MQAIRSLIFNTIMACSAIVYAIPSLLTYPLPFKYRYGFIKQWARFNLWCLAKICDLRYQVIGQENIPKDAVVIFCKHQSTWETFALQNVFPPQVWVLKKELLRVPFFGWGLAMLDPVAIDRSAKTKALQQVVEQGKERLDTGRCVVIFPEGTRIAPGQRVKYQAGGAILAAKTGYAVVPVAHNAGEFWPRHGFIKKPGLITMSIGPMIDTQNKKSSEVMQQAEHWIETEVARISTC